MTQQVNVSALNLAPVREGKTVREALQHTIRSAQAAESYGYHRFWVAEHHNMHGVASSATAVLIGQIAQATKTIRVGSGGIMLPNHAPLIIAEQFGTLAALHPNRIDLGLGRAPGTDQLTAQALRRNGQSAHDFPSLVEELRHYFTPLSANPHVRAIPGEGEDVPVWLLGSSGYSAQMAGELGLPFAFAGHFSPKQIVPALNLYYDTFKPSSVLSEPYSMIAVNGIAAESEGEAHQLATSLYQQFLSMIRNRPGKLQPAVENMDTIWSPHEEQLVMEQLSGSFIGDGKTVAQQLKEFASTLRVNEVMIQTTVYDEDKQIDSYKQIMDAWQ
ncbi:LLM class flavin-dependent oxidoreductase [Alkalihalobacillus sp. LMS6]|uniref:LLM class flavin-dependent oxidoreductase n=1 Tax=Bacillaceae TaxID=186817 RepID=UPI000C07DA57|nr:MULTISPECIES: LLM class flavin-dependent oxidoreductase [Bacillaceae]UTR08121.1 LLM class flavin-dependent oxidoreductase [Alkalihalobacillus sp. LMS6]